MIALDEVWFTCQRKIECQDGVDISIVAPPVQEGIAAGMLGAAVLYLLDHKSHTKEELLALGIQCGFDLGVSMSNTKTQIDAALRAALA